MWFNFYNQGKVKLMGLSPSARFFLLGLCSTGYNILYYETFWSVRRHWKCTAEDGRD